MEKKIILSSERLRICEWRRELAPRLSLISLDDDNRRFLPDEVFETAEDALKTIDHLLAFRTDARGPQAYPIFAGDDFIGHVEISPFGDEWEIGYHIGKEFRGHGYAAEAVMLFMPYIMKKVGAARLWGVCHAENAASRRVLEKCGFTIHDTRHVLYFGNPAEILRYIRSR